MDVEFLRKYIENDGKVVEWSSPGRCRKWSDCVMDLLEDLELFDEVVALEVNLGYEVWHTFVGAKTFEGEEYYFNGVTSGKRDVYFRLATDAPLYLKNNRVDSLVMTERQLKKLKY